jgi:hypothetical protein
MKLAILLPLSFLLLILEINAQKRKTYTVEPGIKATEVIPRDEIYLYPDFTPGMVYFKNKSASTGLLNYNFLFAEIQFINAVKDTLSLADEKTISHIVINKDTFYYDDGYLKFLRNCGEFKLAQKQFLNIAKKEKIGAMGMRTSASVDTYTRVMDSYRHNGLIAQEVLTFARDDFYYFGNKYNHFKRLTKKNLLATYPSRSKEIKDYFKENSFREITEENLVALMESLNSAK